MLKGLAFRLGFILLMAVTVRVGAALFGPSHAEPKLVAVTDRSGATYMLPAELVAGSGGKGVTSEEMRAAIERVRLRGGAGGHDSEARLTFGSGTGKPVVTTPSELAAARADLNRLERSMEAMTSQIERSGRVERSDGVSFEPGKPMVDPTPRS
jgi:hypothetical protein